MASKVIVKMPVATFGQVSKSKSGAVNGDIVVTTRQQELLLAPQSPVNEPTISKGQEQSRVAQLEQNLKFLQEQHQLMLSGLHGEIEILKNRNRELQFQLIFVKGSTPVSSPSSSSEDDLKHKVYSSPKPANHTPLQVEILEREIGELRLQLQDTESRNVHLNSLIEDQKKNLERNERGRKRQRDQVNSGTYERDDPEMYQRLNTAEGLIQRPRERSDVMHTATLPGPDIVRNLERNERGRKRQRDQVNSGTYERDDPEMYQSLNTTEGLIQRPQERSDVMQENVTHYNASRGSGSYRATLPGPYIVRNLERNERGRKRERDQVDYGTYEQNDPEMYQRLNAAEGLIQRPQERSDVMQENVTHYNASRESGSYTATLPYIVRNLERNERGRERNGPEMYQRLNAAEGLVQKPPARSDIMQQNAIRYNALRGSGSYRATLPGPYIDRNQERYERSREREHDQVDYGTYQPNDPEMYQRLKVAEILIQRPRERSDIMQENATRYKASRGSRSHRATLPGPYIVRNLERNERGRKRERDQVDYGTYERDDPEMYQRLNTAEGLIQRPRERSDVMQENATHYNASRGSGSYTATLPGPYVVRNLERNERDRKRERDQVDYGTYERDDPEMYQRLNTAEGLIQRPRERSDVMQENATHYNASRGSGSYTATLPGPYIVRKLERYERDREKEISRLEESELAQRLKDAEVLIRRLREREDVREKATHNNASRGSGENNYGASSPRSSGGNAGGSNSRSNGGGRHKGNYRDDWFPPLNPQNFWQLGRRGGNNGRGKYSSTSSSEISSQISEETSSTLPELKQQNHLHQSQSGSQQQQQHQQRHGGRRGHNNNHYQEGGGGGGSRKYHHRSHQQYKNQQT